MGQVGGTGGRHRWVSSPYLIHKQGIKGLYGNVNLVPSIKDEAVQKGSKQCQHDGCLVPSFSRQPCFVFV